MPLQDDLVGDARLSLLVLLGAVALVLIIACANLANLLLARTHGRARAIALRGALGASRVRVLQQLLEGVLLGMGGGLVGVVAAFYGVPLLVRELGPALPRAQDVAVDGRVLAFTAGMALLTGLLAAAFPAWRLSGRDANEALKQGATRGSSAGDGRARQLLVVSEVALALMLLIGAGRLMRGLSHRRAVLAGRGPDWQARDADDDVSRTTSGRRHRRRRQDERPRRWCRRFGDGDLRTGGPDGLGVFPPGAAHGGRARVAGSPGHGRRPSGRPRAAGPRRAILHT